jgi:hypothetical protein
MATKKKAKKRTNAVRVTAGVVIKALRDGKMWKAQYEQVSDQLKDCANGQAAQAAIIEELRNEYKLLGLENERLQDDIHVQDVVIFNRLCELTKIGAQWGYRITLEPNVPGLRITHVNPKRGKDINRHVTRLPEAEELMRAWITDDREQALKQWAIENATTKALPAPATVASATSKENKA